MEGKGSVGHRLGLDTYCGGGKGSVGHRLGLDTYCGGGKGSVGLLHSTYLTLTCVLPSLCPPPQYVSNPNLCPTEPLPQVRVRHILWRRRRLGRTQVRVRHVLWRRQRLGRTQVGVRHVLWRRGRHSRTQVRVRHVLWRRQVEIYLGKLKIRLLIRRGKLS